MYQLCKPYSHRPGVTANLPMFFWPCRHNFGDTELKFCNIFPWNPLMSAHINLGLTDIL